MIITTSRIAISKVSSTSLMAFLTNKVLSNPISRIMSFGRSFFMVSRRLYSSSAIAIWLDPGCATTARFTERTLFFLVDDSSFSGPKIAYPISLKRITLPLVCLMIKLLKSSSLVSFPYAFTVISVALPLTFPPGNSTFSLSSAAFTSWIVSL